MKTKTKIIAAAITAYLAVGATMAFAGTYKEPYSPASLSGTALLGIAFMFALGL